jgi:hypothetical protein
VPPGYDGLLPEGGFFVAKSRTNRVLYAARSFLENNDPKPTVELIKKYLKIYPYTPGGFGTSIATALEGEVQLAKKLTKEGMFKPLPSTGARTLDSRTAFYYAYTLDSPGMIMRIPDVGSQYLMGFLDSDGNPYDGSKTYKVRLPKDIPARAFWSLTLYDNQTRSMLDTPQRYPRAGSQTYPSPAAEPDADGSSTVYFAPTQPEGVKRGNWIQTDPKKGWFTILRLYSPLDSFFTKEWRPSEIELVQ